MSPLSSAAPPHDEPAAAKLQAHASDLLTTSTTKSSNADDFPQGCLFSPDGSCILTSVGKTLRLYNTADAFTSHWKAALHCQAAESIRSFAWYPHMQSDDPSTCCFLTTSRDQPVHLYDAYTGKVRAAYCPYNALDEIEAPNVAIFHPKHGQTLVAGGFRTDRRVYVFDVHRPGRQAQAVWKLGNTKRSSDGQKGLISALAHSRQHEALLAVGTYAPGSIYLYDVRQPPSQVLVGLSLVGHGKHSVKRKRRFWVSTDSSNSDPTNEEWISAAKWQWLVQKTQTGVTHLQFDDDYTMFSSSRRSNVVLAWDLRMFRPLDEEDTTMPTTTTGGLQSFSTVNDTNQRLGCDLDGESNTLFIGGQDATVRLYNAQNGQSKGSICLSSKDSQAADATQSCAVNGVSYHKMKNGTRWLAISTGERRFPVEQDYDDAPSLNNTPQSGSLQLHQLLEAPDKEQN